MSGTVRVGWLAVGVLSDLTTIRPDSVSCKSTGWQMDLSMGSSWRAAQHHFHHAGPLETRSAMQKDETCLWRIGVRARERMGKSNKGRHIKKSLRQSQKIMFRWCSFGCKAVTLYLSRCVSSSHFKTSPKVTPVLQQSNTLLYFFTWPLPQHV